MMTRSDFRIIVRVAVITVLAVVALAIIRSIPDFFAIHRGFTEAIAAASLAQQRWDADGMRGAAAVAATLADARRSFERSVELASSIPIVRFLPGFHGALAAAAAAADAGAAWTGGAATLLDTASDGERFAERYADRTLADLTSGERAELIGFLGSALARGRDAVAAFDRGEARAVSLARRWCPAVIANALGLSICANGRVALDRIPAIAAVRVIRGDAASAVHALDAALALLGGTTDRRLLLLFLNDTEIRPGGGFLGTYGIATLREGEIVGLDTDDVYNLDRRVEGVQRIEPPVPFRRHGIVTWWYLRDANWSPDFAVSARTVTDFFLREGGPTAIEPDAVLGFTTSFAASLLKIVGPITVRGVRYDAATVADILEYEVERGYYEQGIPRDRRKAIITPLSRALVDRFRNLPFRAWSPVVAAVGAAARERHVMAYAADVGLERAFEQLGIAGRVTPVPSGSDALLVVDANLGSLKTDPFVRRTIRYAIAPDGSGYRGTVTLRYRNTGTFTWKSTRYRTYTRVYLPIGTDILAVRGMMARDRSDEPGVVDRGEELGRTWVGAFVSVEPGQERTLEFDVRLAPSVADSIRRGRYALGVQKQLGAGPTPLTVDLDFGTTVGSAIPPEPPAASGDTRYHMETDLREDREFHVELGR